MNRPSLAVGESPSGASPACRRWFAAMIAVAAVLHAAALWQARPLQSANDRSRWCTVWSLIHRGTYAIDEIRRQPGWDSIDIIYDGEHFYSTKPPLLSTLVAGVAAVVERVTGADLLSNPLLVTRLTLLIVNGVPQLLAWWLMALMIDRLAQSDWTRLVLVLTTCVGTLLSPFVSTLNNHTVAAVGVVMAVYGLLRVLERRATLAGDERAWELAFAGFGAGWAAANELPAAFLLAAICCRIGLGASWRGRVWFAMGSGLPLLAMLLVNYAATGDWKPTYAAYGSRLYVFVFEGVPSYWMEPHGIDRNLDSPLGYLFHCTLGHHGIWSLTPLFLWCWLSWCFWLPQHWRRKSLHGTPSPTFLPVIDDHSTPPTGLRTIVGLSAAASVVTVGFFLTRTANYNFGGVSCALRWVLWIVPLWLLTLVPALDAAAGCVRGRFFVILTLVPSCWSVWTRMENPWHHPWLYYEMQSAGWINYEDPPPKLDRPHWSWIGTLPELAENGAAVWAEFTSQDAGRTQQSMRLSVGPAAAGTPKNDFVELTVTQKSRQGALPMQQIRLNRSLFNQGAKLEEVLGEGSTSAEEFLAGLPEPNPYQAAPIQYLFLPLRRDAFRCQRAATRKDFLDELGNPWRYRVDTWYCDEVPFGVVQVEFTIIDATTGAIHRKERWTLSEANPPVPERSPLSDPKQAR